MREKFNKMRLLPIVVMVLLVTSVFVFPDCSCKGKPEKEQGRDVHEEAVADNAVEDGEENDSIESNQYVPPEIPEFVQSQISNADWYAETICVANNKAYYLAREEFGRMTFIYNDDMILAGDPTLQVNAYDSEDRNKRYVSVTDRSVLIDFSDANSVKSLSSLLLQMPHFTRYHKDSLAEFGRTVHYSFTADFPKKSVTHADIIRKWLVGLIADSQTMMEKVPPLNALYIGYTKRPKENWEYKGDLYNHDKIAEFASSMYFAIKKGEYGTNEEDYPSYLFSTLNLQAKVMNERFVTYQRYKHDYEGGAHGYYTEKLISYDHVHQQEIDFNYLFKPLCGQELLKNLLEVASTYPQYEKEDPDINEYVCVTDEDGNPTGELHFPQPGLSEKGVVFSFQPYEISCFAAGSFHYTIPYSKIKHLLTTRGKWCINNFDDQ